MIIYILPMKYIAVYSHKINSMNREQIGAKCIKARGERTKYRLSKDSGLTIGQIERVENGNDNYTVDVLVKYLNALKLKIEIK